MEAKCPPGTGRGRSIPPIACPTSASSPSCGRARSPAPVPTSPNLYFLAALAPMTLQGHVVPLNLMPSSALCMLSYPPRSASPAGPAVDPMRGDPSYRQCQKTVHMAFATPQWDLITSVATGRTGEGRVATTAGKRTELDPSSSAKVCRRGRRGGEEEGGGDRMGWSTVPN
jgi:hypothetical protein